MGYMLWTNGLSSSIALANTDTSSPLNVIYSVTHQTVPLSLTIFQPYSYLTVLVAFVALAFAILRDVPARDAPRSTRRVFELERGRTPRTPARRPRSRSGWRASGSST